MTTLALYAMATKETMGYCLLMLGHRANDVVEHWELCPGKLFWMATVLWMLTSKCQSLRHFPANWKMLNMALNIVRGILLMAVVVERFLLTTKWNTWSGMAVLMQENLMSEYDVADLNCLSIISVNNK